MRSLVEADLNLMPTVTYSGGKVKSAILGSVELDTDMHSLPVCSCCQSMDVHKVGTVYVQVFLEL